MFDDGAVLSRQACWLRCRLLLLFDDNKIKNGKKAREEIEGKSGRMHRGRCMHILKQEIREGYRADKTGTVCSWVWWWDDHSDIGNCEDADHSAPPTAISNISYTSPGQTLVCLLRRFSSIAIDVSSMKQCWKTESTGMCGDFHCIFFSVKWWNFKSNN